MYKFISNMVISGAQCPHSPSNLVRGHQSESSRFKKKRSHVGLVWHQINKDHFELRWTFAHIIFKLINQ